MRNGEKGYLAIKDGGDAAIGGYAELTLTGDLTLNSEITELDVSRRGSKWKLYEMGLTDLTIEGSALCKLTDTQLAILRTAHYAGTVVGVQCRENGSTSTGVKFDAYVSQFSHDEPLDDTMRVNFKLVPQSDPSLLVAS